MPPPAATLTVGPLTLSEASRTVTNAGRPLALTPLEFRLLPSVPGVGFLLTGLS